jgi:small subunit ribosomal protein S13
LARIAGVDLPKQKRVEIALTYIYGIGRSTSIEILSKIGVDPNTRSDDLTESQMTLERSLMGNTRSKANCDLKSP